MARRKSEHASVAPQGAGGAGPGVMRAVVIITCATAIVAMIRGPKELNATDPLPTSSPTPTILSDAASSSSLPANAPVDSTGSASDGPISEPSATEEAREDESPMPAVPRIGIVAGHWGSDEGASCPDGLTEVEVNLTIAEFVVQSLRGLGYRVDLLQEYDDRLEDYVADALVSIHADSCLRLPEATPAPTGFKVASVVDSYVPEEEQRLVRCLTEAYAERTGLPFHENSITGHMTGYHTFYDIDGRTPGAIIETGFLWLDRDLLTEHPDIVAQGIVDGILCLVEGE